MDGMQVLSRDNYSDWRILDDGVMGGKSRSSFTVNSTKGQENFISYGGVTNTNGGGFCGIRSKYDQPFDLRNYDGICATMKSDKE